MKKTLLSLLYLSLSFPCFSQIGFSEQEITSFTKNTEDILEIDFDNDGDLDIIAIGLQVIDLYENIGGQYNFSSKRTLVTYANNSSSHNLYDFDMDNDLDIVYANNTSQDIVWHENDGSGNFGDVQIIASNLGAIVRSLSFADMDGDTDDDIVYTVWLTQSTQRALWLENDGSATNYTVANTMFDSNIATPILLDFDTDGDLDAIVGASNSANWFHNDGNGNFGTETTYPLTNTIFQFDVVDIDGDNDYDFVYHKFFTTIERIMYYENEGNNTFMTEHIIAEGDFNNKTLAVEDVDNDNRLDVIYVEDALSTPSRLVWKKNLDTNGNFGAPNLIYDDISNMDKILTVDFDNDGDEDVISTWNDLILFNENTDSQGTFAQEKAIAFTSFFPGSIVHGDIDADGDIDIVVSENNTTFGIVLYKAENANGVDYYSPKQFVNRSVSNVYNIFLYDVDGDTDLDLLLSSEGSGSATSHRLSWLENVDGQGNFSEPISITDTSSYSINEMALFDVDGDTDKDVVAVIAYSSFNKQLVWFENSNGQGTFSALQVIDTNVGFSNYITGEDLNNDGTIDIVLVDASNDRIAWFPNNGSGSFGAQQTIIQNISNVYELAIADFDGDTFVDIAYMNNASPTSIEWIQNTDGAGNFGQVQSIVPNLGFNQTRVISAADMDNDGDQDIITSAIPSLPGPSQVIWVENLDGQANFSLPLTIGDNLQNITNLLVADVSNNGFLDVIITDENKNTMFCYKNLGNALNRISGTVRLDIDANGCDISDNALPNFLVNITDGTNSYGTFTLNDNSLEGYYQYLVDEGSYTVSIGSDIPNYFSFNPISQVASFTSGGNEDVIDFCVEPTTTANDLNIAIYPSINDPRPGFDTTYQIVYRNIGTTVLNGDVSFQFDATKLQFLNASEPVDSQTANTVTFNFSNLNPLEVRTIDLAFNIFTPPTTNIDDILISTATINPVSGDATPDDNTFTLNQTVIGSYDPNDILVLQGDEVPIDAIDNYLNYIIRFQNTGTASAINVRVEHILDSKLDWATIQVESLSHPGRVEILNGNNMSFIFDNINLPNSTTDEPNSHGYIAFKIKPKNDVVVGDIISGIADIYFDFNPAIITNIVNTEIVAPLSNVEFDENTITIFPNPANDKLVIQAKFPIDQITILDINGKLLKSSVLSNSKKECELNVSELSQGIYFLKIQTNSGTQTQKIIKQ